jgi:transcriptional regulator with XRE-family HTH domain
VDGSSLIGGSKLIETQDRINCDGSPIAAHGFLRSGRAGSTALKKGLSRGALAGVAGIHHTYASLLERGERKPTIDVAERVARPRKEAVRTHRRSRAKRSDVKLAATPAWFGSPSVTECAKSSAEGLSFCQIEFSVLHE